MRLDSLVSASRRETKVRVVHGTLALGGGFYVACLTFRSIRSFVYAVAYRAYCVAQPKRWRSFKR
jgi:hypothetical protein